ncbi:MAG: Holliday junction branch migration protein RuvA [Dehalococcoidia bacterium]|jgi:Holliday junction DNA helicase RuvA|nr:Holliday junction branch migration protein RuvA [Dehalococcoidia bacterium]
MIAALRGQFVQWHDESNTLWLDVSGVTYELIVPAFASDWVAQHEAGSELHLFTYYHVAERSPKPLVIGFPRLVEREFFRKFIEVPDVGPVKAVRALTRPVSEIAGWVEAEDVKALQQLPGIGVRLAQTIVARLHGKLVQEALLRDEVDGAAAVATPDLRDDAVAALVQLQYGRREAESVVDAVLLSRTQIEGLEELLRVVLEQQAPAG